MVSKLVKIALTAGIIVLVGNFGINKYHVRREYGRVYSQFVREVSGIQSPDYEDLPTTQEWQIACAEIGYNYDRTGRETPRPTIEQMEKWLEKRGK